MSILFPPLPVYLLHDLREALIVLARVPAAEFIKGKRVIYNRRRIFFISRFFAGSGNKRRGFIGAEGRDRREGAAGAAMGGGGGSRGSLASSARGTALEDLELGVANDDGIAGAGGLEPVEAVAELGDVGEEITLDDLLDRGDISVLVEDDDAALPRVLCGGVDIWG